MSINACTINCSQIDDLCSYRRQANINVLPPFVPTAVGGGQQQHVNPSYGPAYQQPNIFRRDREREDNTVDVNTLELPSIAVSVEFNGQTYFHTIDRGDESLIPLINVFNLKISDSVLESVNISDIRLLKG